MNLYPHARSLALYKTRLDKRLPSGFHIPIVLQNHLCGVFEAIEELPQKFVVMDTDVAKMKAYIAANTGL